MQKIFKKGRMRYLNADQRIIILHELILLSKWSQLRIENKTTILQMPANVNESYIPPPTRCVSEVSLQL